jgi:2-dehydro-3-deoxyphosphogluconate aldolase / (4S)-4-hydroxy-2-oxoglutarate aldolase
MMTTVERIRAERIVAVLRRAADPDAVVDSLARGGIGIVELTLDSDDALAAIERLRGARPELTVLAGTVRTTDDAEAAVSAGAQACVSPGLVPAVVERCRELGVPAIPGALTPSEIEAALALRVELVKLFPAGFVGPGYVRDVLAPLGNVPLLVTGGIDSANAGNFLAAGAAAVGVGSALTGAADVELEARRILAALS